MHSAPISVKLLVAATASALWLAVAVWAIIAAARQRARADVAEAWGKRLHALINTTPHGWLLIDAQDHVYSTVAIHQWLGSAAPVTTLGMLVDLVQDHQEQLALKRHIAQLRASGTQFSCKLHIEDRTFVIQGKPIAVAMAASNDQIILWLLDVSDSQGVDRLLGAGQTALRESLDAVTTLIEAAPLPIWRRDEEFRLTHVNSAYVTAVEAVSAEAVIAEATELVRLSATQPSTERPTSGSRLHSHEETAIINGKLRTLLIHDVAFANAYAGFAIDTTEQHHMKSELDRYMNAHRETLDMLSTPVAIFGPDKHLVFHNAAFSRLFNLDPAWFAERPLHSDVLDHLRDTRRLPEKVDYRGWKQAELEHYTSLLTPKEDMWHLPDNTTLRVVTQPHPLGGIQVLFEDVTARLVLERSYNTLINVQQVTLNNLHEGVALFQSDGHVRLFNKALAVLLRVDEDVLLAEPHVNELLDKTQDVFNDDEGKNKLRQQIQTMVQRRENISGELHSNDQRIITYAGVPLPDGAALLTFVDVTDSRNKERLLQENNAALQVADRIKSQFVQNMSYELRTPLTSIIGFSEMLEQGYLGKLSDKQTKYIKNILISSQKLDGLVGDLLDLALITADDDIQGNTLDRRSVDVAYQIKQAVSKVADRAQKMKSDITIYCDDSVGSISGDNQRITQMVEKLLDNALSFTAPEGRISVSAHGTAHDVRITVADTGVGISAEDQKTVFERFTRGSNSHTVAGAGLGLSLVKHFVELHGGTILLTSQEAIGTEVEITLPRNVDSTHARTYN